MGGLTWIGFCWTILSTTATVFIIGGVLTPEWLIGQVSAEGVTLKAYFGSYKRCNYPVIDKESSRIALLAECGRYESFADVPSTFWQVAILCSAIGASLSLLLCLLMLPSICLNSIIDDSTALMVGCFQIISAILIALSLVLYPLGWDNPEVKDACGELSDRFVLGNCELGKSYMSMMLGAGMLVISAFLSLCGGKKNKFTFYPEHNRTLIHGFDNTRLDLAK